MPAPSKNPSMARVSRILSEAASFYEPGAFRMGSDYSCVKEDFGREEAFAVTQDTSQLKDHGPETWLRIASGIISGGLLAKKQRPDEVNPVVNGQQHPFIAAIIINRGHQFFTLKRSQALALDEYTNLPDNSCQYFIIHEEQAGPQPLPAMTGAGAILEPQQYRPMPGVPQPLPYPRNANANDEPQRGELTNDYHSSREPLMFGVDWNQLYTPERILPGSLVPKCLIRQHSTTRSMIFSDITIHELGQACAAETEAVALNIQENIRGLGEMQAISDPQDADPVQMSHEELVELVNNLRKKDRRVTRKLAGISRTAHSSQVRARGWKAVFQTIGHDQAVNRRPGLWSPAIKGRPSELGRIEDDVQAMFHPESIYPQNEPVGTPPSHPPQSGYPAAAQQTGQSIASSHLAADAQKSAQDTSRGVNAQQRIQQQSGLAGPGRDGLNRITGPHAGNVWTRMRHFFNTTILASNAANDEKAEGVDDMI